MTARIQSTKQVSIFFCKKMIFFYVDKANVMFLVASENGKEKFKGTALGLQLSGLQTRGISPLN